MDPIDGLHGGCPSIFCLFKPRRHTRNITHTSTHTPAKREMALGWPELGELPLLAFVNKQPEMWGERDVQTWLGSVGMTTYQPEFEGVDGKELLELDSDGLKELGVYHTIISHLHTKSALLMKISCCPNIFLLLFGFSLRPTSPFGFSLRPTSQFGFSLRPTSQFGFSLRPTSPFGFSTSPHFFIWIFTSPHFSVWIFTSPHFSVWIFHFASLLHLDFHFAPLLSLDFPLCPTSLFGFSTSPHFSVWIFTSPHFSVWIFHFAPLLSLDFPLRPTSRRVGGELE